MKFKPVFIAIWKNKNEMGAVFLHRDFAFLQISKTGIALPSCKLFGPFFMICWCYNSAGLNLKKAWAQLNWIYIDF